MTTIRACHFVASAVASVALAAGALAGLASCKPSNRVWNAAVLAPFAPEKKHVEILFTGDVSTARGIADAIDKQGHGDPAWTFQEIRPTLDSADLVFANLECVLSDTDDGKVGKTYAIRSPVKYAAKLKEVGVDVVSVANNHALDFSHGGFWSTLNEVSKLGIGVTGVNDGPSAKPEQTPLIVNVGPMKVGFIAYNAHGDEWKHPDQYPRPQLYDKKSIAEDIKRLRPLVDQVVVSVHWGPELAHEPWQWQVDDAHAFVDAGADLIIGHHPHVPQSVEEYNGGLIAYSLGDFVFDKQSPFLRTRTGPRFFLKVAFDDKKRSSFELVPVNHDAHWRPHVEPAQDTASWIMKPDVSTWRASAAVAKAAVVRTGADGAHPCASFTKKRPKLAAGYMRWLEQRFMCDNDEKKPGNGVGRASELSATVMRHGIWMSPNDDVTRVSFKGVPLTGKLVGYAGWPDFVVLNEGKQKVPVTTPVTVSVLLDEKVVLTQEIPLERGWKEFVIESPAAAKNVAIEVAGKRRDEPGFVVELQVMP